MKDSFTNTIFQKQSELGKGYNARTASNLTYDNLVYICLSRSMHSISVQKVNERLNEPLIH